MKKLLLLLPLLLFTISKTAVAQRGGVVIHSEIKTEDEKYTIENPRNFVIVKKDVNTDKQIYRAETDFPDKSKGEYFLCCGYDAAYFNLVGDKIIIVYDLWMKNSLTKECFIQSFDVKTRKFSAKKQIYSTKLNSQMSSNEIPHKAFYSPDKTKLAVLKDNISLGYDFAPELTIFDSKTFEILSTKTISGKYQGEKRIFDLTNFSISNSGDITLVFHLMNPKTKLTTKSFSAEIPFAAKDLINIKDLHGNVTSDAGGNNTHGRFYKTLQDYIDDKPMPGVRIKNGSFKWSLIGGTDFKLIDDEGNIKKEDAKDLPSEIFTYKSDNASDPWLLKISDKTPYIVLVAGKLCFYSKYSDQQMLYYSEGWNGELQKFREGDLEDYLKKYNLWDDYKKDKPKREMRDDVNGYFNKTVFWRIKYFQLLNKKM